MILKDYIVAYEGECDPQVHSCYAGCEDDACTQEYFYDVVEKRATDIYAQCGSDITDCEAANACLSEERGCSITYCDPAADGDSCRTAGSE
jgi:hypothetical protein